MFKRRKCLIRVSGIARISNGLHVVTLSKRNFSLLRRPNTISEAADLKGRDYLHQSTQAHV